MSYLNPDPSAFCRPVPCRRVDRQQRRPAFRFGDIHAGRSGLWPGREQRLVAASGTGAWRLCGCVITAAAWDGNFATTSAGDPVIGLPLKNSGDRVDAKLVDLDPDQQMVSMIFGLQVRIADPVSGAVLMTGELLAGAIHGHLGPWRRGRHRGQRVLPFDAYRCRVGRPVEVARVTGVAGGDAAGPVVDAVHARQLQYGWPHARLWADRRHHWSRARRRATAFRRRSPFGVEAGKMLGNVTCCIDPKGTQILADFGNALKNDATRQRAQFRRHSSGCSHERRCHREWRHASGGGRYCGSGIAGRLLRDRLLPADRGDPGVSAQSRPDRGCSRRRCKRCRLAVVQSDGAGGWNVWAAEAPDGIYARADMFVYRINPPAKTGLSQSSSPGLASHWQGQTVVATISANSIGGTFPVSTPTSALQLDFSGPNRQRRLDHADDCRQRSGPAASVSRRPGLRDRSVGHWRGKCGYRVRFQSFYQRLVVQRDRRARDGYVECATCCPSCNNMQTSTRGRMAPSSITIRNIPANPIRRRLLQHR